LTNFAFSAFSRSVCLAIKYCHAIQTFWFADRSSNNFLDGMERKQT
jgi:hypothetical protein